MWTSHELMVGVYAIVVLAATSLAGFADQNAPGQHWVGDGLRAQP